MLLSDLVTVGVLNLLCLVAACVFCLRCRLPLYHPCQLFCIYYFVGYVLRPFTIAVSGESGIWQYVGFWPSSLELYIACAYMNLGLFAFVFGPSILNPSWFSVGKMPTLRLVVNQPKRFLIVATLLATVGLLAVLGSHQGAGLDSVLAYEISVDDRGAQRLVGTSGYSTLAADFLPAILLTLFLVVGPRREMLLLIAAFIILRVWIGAGRNAFFLLVCTLVFVQLMRSSRQSISFRTLFGGLLLILLFDIVGSDRLAFRRLLGGETSVFDIVTNYLVQRAPNALTSDFSEFDVATALYSVIPSETGFNWLSQYLRILVWPIPRQIWPDKPVITAMIDLSSIGNYFALTWSLGVDLYSNFGLPSLVLGMFLISSGLCRLYYSVASKPTASSFVSFWTITMYLPLLFRDSLPMFVYMIGAALLCVQLLRWAGELTLTSLPASPDAVGARERVSVSTGHRV